MRPSARPWDRRLCRRARRHTGLPRMAGALHGKFGLSAPGPAPGRRTSVDQSCLMLLFGACERKVTVRPLRGASVVCLVPIPHWCAASRARARTGLETTCYCDGRGISRSEFRSCWFGKRSRSAGSGACGDGAGRTQRSDGVASTRSAMFQSPLGATWNRMPLVARRVTNSGNSGDISDRT